MKKGSGIVICMALLAFLTAISAFADEVNLAYGKRATQSSTGYGGDPQRAVDGNTDGNYYANSVTHTNNAPNEWWQVDLGSVQDIGRIRIWNRTDCCGGRLSKFYVLVSETPFHSSRLQDAFNQPGVWNTFVEKMESNSREINVNQSGRYVRIQLLGADHLSLAEVEVFGSSGHRHSHMKTQSNLALGKRTTQSSTGYGGGPGRAVDGNTDGNFFANSVSHTNNAPNEWWQVDLGAVQDIDKIRIWNRTDCCSQRLSNFYVLVSDSPFRSTRLQDSLDQPGVWNAFFENIEGPSSSINVNRSGRYVRIQLSGADYLSIAEVEVFGTSSGASEPEMPHKPRKGSNLALKKRASQSSTGFGGDPGRAVDGNTDGNFSANSVTHTNNAPNEWWQVDLGAVKNIDTVRIWNRTDCCSQRLSNFYVLISETPFTTDRLKHALHQPDIQKYRYEGTAGPKTEIRVDTFGRYVRIQLAGTDYLSLAEVEVIGGGRK